MRVGLVQKGLVPPTRYCARAVDADGLAHKYPALPERGLEAPST